MYKIGFTTVTFRDLSPAEVCKIADENDIRNIEWGGDIHLPPLEKEKAAETAALNKKYSLCALSYGSYYRLGAKDFELWREICEAASQIGAKVIRIWMGEKSSCDVNEDLFREMVEETKKLAEAAAEKNLTVAFEFHHGTYNDSGATSLRFLKAVDMDNVKTYWQPFSTKEDTENLKAVLPYLAGVHVFHWNKYGKRYALKRGKRKWKKFISLIAESCGDMNYIMEFVKKDSVNQFKKDLAALRGILEEVYYK